jgi:hypothetical protein
MEYAIITAMVITAVVAVIGIVDFVIELFIKK